MGVVFYRGLYPSDMGYAELRYYNDWHEKMVEAEEKAIQNAKTRKK